MSRSVTAQNILVQSIQNEVVKFGPNCKISKEGALCLAKLIYADMLTICSLISELLCTSGKRGINMDTMFSALRLNFRDLKCHDSSGASPAPDTLAHHLLIMVCVRVVNYSRLCPLSQNDIQKTSFFTEYCDQFVKQRAALTY